MGPRAIPAIALVLVTGFLGLALVWTLRNLGDVPRYGDTREYLTRARTLEVDQYRGIAYPALLAVADRLWPGPRFLHRSLPDRCDPPQPCEATRGLVPVQLLQWAVGLIALAYALSTVAGSRLSALSFALVRGLLWLDPLVGHHHVAIMTEGLALAASLAFCGAWVEWVRGRPRPALALAILVASQVLLMELRTEKGAVVMTTAVASTLALLLLARRASERWLDASVRRGVAALGVVAVVAAATAFVDRNFVKVDLGRWPSHIWVLHMRVVFPHLESIYDDLSPAAQERISRRAAGVYDTSIVRARYVMNAAVRRDPESRGWLTGEMARAALRAHGAEIALDVLKDAAENVLATFSFYTRLGLWRLRGADPDDYLVRFDAAAWIWHNLSLYHPMLSLAYVVAAAGLLLLALVPASLAARRALGRGGPGREVLTTVTPFAAFAVANAFAFALAQDSVNARYTLLAHVALLTALYLGALAWWRQRFADRGPAHP